ncbi:MAG: hypothetical protein RLY31_2021 [Bacteroidota bacterium]|jgi:cellulose synthase/poly-beta-1,6-N-acetylglucosamine synthase-like glycosyltransferase
MTVAEWIHHLVYVPSLALTAAFCLNQLYLLLVVRRFRHRALPEPTIPPYPGTLPFVTIQLPLYNERFVVGRLLDCIARMDYPADRFEIQVLDDSTDETCRIARTKVADMQKTGLQAVYLHRRSRTGFKAGALAEGMRSAKGGLIAIFDADFLPEPDFLRRAVPLFADPVVGVVQGRWTHLNEQSNLLTRLQALQLNVHFRTEQPGRQAGGYFLQFNGTAGIWRREAIDSAGGWRDDSLTEDLELSMRAQLAGWKICYLPTLTVPAELPVNISAIKTQQYRWMKGGAETARRWLPVIATSGLSPGVRWQAILQLTGSSVFLPIVLLSLSSLVPAGTAAQTGNSILGMTGLLAFFSVQFLSNWPESSVRGSVANNRLRTTFRLVLLFPMFLALSLGFSLRNAWAVLEGWANRRSPFVRTPKFNILPDQQDRRTDVYLTRTNWHWLEYGELVLSVVFLIATVFDILEGRSGSVTFHLLLATGYGMIVYHSLDERIRNSRTADCGPSHGVGKAGPGRK